MVSSRDIESEKAPKGLNEDIVRYISAQEGRAGMAARLAPRGLSPLADHDAAALGAGRVPRDRLPGPLLFRRAQVGQGGAEVARRGRSRAAAHLRQARNSAGRAGNPRRRRAPAGRGRRGVRLGLGRHHLQGRARQGRRDLLLVLGSGARARRSGASAISARSCRRPTISMRRSTRRCSPTARSFTCRLACAARWSFRPIFASTRRTPASSSAR